MGKYTKDYINCWLSLRASSTDWPQLNGCHHPHPQVATLPAPEDVYITEEDIRVPDPGEIFGPLVESVPVSRASTRTNLISQKGSRENLASQKGSRETLLSRGSSKAGSKVVRWVQHPSHCRDQHYSWKCNLKYQLFSNLYEIY